MVINIPEIQPFTFQAGTAFSERVQLADKINEIIDGINQIGDIPELEGQIATLASQIQAINTTITTIQNTMAQQGTTIQDIQGDISTLDEQMASAMSDITGLTSRIATAESTLTEHGNEISGLLGEVIDSVEMSSTAHGTVQVQINHEDGSNDISAPIDLGLIQTGGITLQTGASDRSFKLIITQTDGESWQTNDFIIPPGGGTEVTITSVTLEAGTTENTMRVSIGLSDGTPLDSNDYPVVAPATVSALATRVTTVEGTTAQHTTQISGLDSRVTALEEAGGYTLVPATASQLGGVKIGANIIVQSDGTISIPNATASTPGVMTAAQVEQLNSAATASTLMFTGDASKVTLHADSVAGSAFTEDIPQASQGGAGTIDQAKYQQIGTNQNNITTIQGKVTTLENEVGTLSTDIENVENTVNGLAPSVSVNEEVNPPTITIGINGKSATANLPVGGDGEWEEIVLGNNPRDFVAGDILFGYFTYKTSGSASSWTTAPTKNPTITADPDARIPFSIMLGERYGTDKQLLTMTAGLYNVRITIISLIADIDVWNNSDTGSVLLTIVCFSMNGGGFTDKSLKITKANASTNIYKLYRKKR